MITGKSPKSRPITGVMMNYLHVCHTELWYFAHNVVMEHSSDIVALGRIVHEEYYSRDTSKEELILEGIRIDRITADGFIHEVKKSNRAEEAHVWQLKYYLWILKNHGFGELKGMLEFPTQRKRLKIELSVNDEKRIVEKIEQIRTIIRRDEPPKATKVPFCRRCSYRDLCWC